MTTLTQGSQIITSPGQGDEVQSCRKIRAPYIFGGIITLVFLAGSYWYWNQLVPVALTVSPAEASLVLNGKDVALGEDGALHLKRGKHLLEVVSPGHSAHKEVLDLLFGKPVPYSISLSVLPGLLSVITQPDQATISIDGTVVGQTPLIGHILEPGEYEIVVEAENYLPHQEKATVHGRRQRTRLEVSLTPAWSHVSLNTSPEGATLYLNKQQVGKTPLSMELLQGRYDLRLEMENREAQQFSIRVPANQTLKLPTWAMEWKHGSLNLSTIPEGAWVTVNGEPLGQTPGTFSLPSKTELNFAVSLLDHEERSFNLKLNPDQTIAQKLVLSPLVGELRIETKPSKADVYLDGRIKGLSPLNLELPVGDYDLELRKAGYTSQTHKLRPQAQKTARYSFELISEIQGIKLTDDQILRALIAQKKDIQKEVASPYGYQLILIEPDTYIMGLPQEFSGRGFDETPVEMRIRQPFYIGLHEVSNREFNRFKSNHDSGIVSGVSLQSGDRPVVNVSWKEAVEYCNWLSDIQGLKPAYQLVADNYKLIEPRTDGYRLPTEAEWEFVARYHQGTTEMIYPWGMEMPPPENSGNFAGSEAKVMIGQSVPGYRDGYQATSPVGSFSANSLGLFDIGGNVSEWCTDYYSYTYPTSPDPLVDYAGPDKGAQRLIRGSSWRSVTNSELRSTSKRYGLDGADDVGFRLARSYPIVVE